MTSVRSASSHVAEILNVVNNQLCTRETSALVTRSWARCLRDFQLDPAQQRIPSVLTQPEFNARRDRMSDLISCAKLEMTTLYQQLADPELAVVLTDADGVIMHMVSSTAFSQDVEPLGFRVGALWSEREAGTNGMGTCLVEGEPVAVRQDEHYFAQYTSLTCSASPLFDDSGKLIGVLDVTSRSPLLQQHSLVLVGMSRQMIENRLLDERYKDAFQIHFHSRPELVYTLHEGKLIIGHDGRVLAANRSALFQLGFRALSGLLGKSIDEVFKTSLEESVARSARNSFHPVPIYRASASNRFFMVAQPPQTATTDLARAGAAAAKPGPLAKKPLTETRGAEPAAAVLGSLSFGDAQMDEQIRLAQRVITRRIPILLHGETGCGKEVFANALHRMSPSCDGPFVAVNCASLPETLIESELFGYRAGAFTGAQREGRRGKIIQANGGTLFLDEIGDMPLALQARLLRVLEEREVTPLGSEAVVKVDFHLVSASHRDLTDLVRSGQFREDLYYRLNGIALHLPPLRERTDRLALMRHLLAEECGQADCERTPDFAPDAEQALLRYPWPGNIRQLRNVLRIASALCDGDTIECQHLPAEILRGAGHADAQRAPALQAVDGAAAVDLDEAEALAQFNAIQLNERDTILGLLHKHRWNISTVARSLSVSRNTLYRKMHRLHIKVTQVETAEEP
ncbi:sigma-54-dependent Fis family transcriptional regulator [Cupriavidus necator]|uniref:sigma-54-dependent Fis family transcriptional regulator n=1 Tax=Cupriavidus necator TaxID=106590 RepID=UPI00339D7A00